MDAESKSSAPAISMEDLPLGTMLEVETRNRKYEMKILAGDRVLISGHPKYCPEPVVVFLCFASASSDTRQLSEGTNLSYWHPHHGMIITSPVQQIRCAAPPGRSLMDRPSAPAARMPDCLTHSSSS